MKKLLKRPDYFLILSLSFTYFLGLIQASSLGRTISILLLLSGLFFMLGFYFALTFSWPEPYFSSTTQRSSRTQRSRTEPRIILLLASIALTFISLFFLIRAHFFEYLLLPSALILLLSAFFVLNVSARAQSQPYRWLLDAFSISPVAYFFGLLITGIDVSFFPFMLALPLFMVASGSTISIFFARFEEDISLQQYPSMHKFNWNRLAQLHDIVAFLAYPTLAAYIYFSGAMTIAWPTLLLILVALGCSLLLHRIVQGMHPNWKLLKAMAVFNYLSLVYILGFAFLTH